MGAEYSGTIRPELLSAKKVMGYSPMQVELLRQKFILKCDDDLAIDVKGFQDIMKVSDKVAKDVFKLFDIDNSGKIDSYELLSGVALLGHCSLKVKPLDKPGKRSDSVQTLRFRE